MRVPPQLVTLETAFGPLALVLAAEVMHWDREAAQRWLGAAMARDEGIELALRQLAQQLGAPGTEPLEVVARAIDSGALMVMALPRREAVVPVPAPVDAGVFAWDDAVPLSSLRGADPAPEAPAEPSRPGCTTIAIDGWAEARCVLVPGPMHAVAQGVATVRGALLRLLTAPPAHWHVIGHADTRGGRDDNEALALERAHSLWVYLQGDREGWAAHAFAHADVATLQAALSWAAGACALPCDPGPIDGDWGPATAAALDGLRAHAGIDPALPLGSHDWAALFDLYDDDLARLLGIEVAALTQRKRALSLDPPQSVGERWPVTAAARDAFACADNRRVELVRCDEPPPCADAIYDGTYARAWLDVPDEVRVELFVHAPDLSAIAGARVTLELASLGPRAQRADARGLVALTVLRGERVRLSSARRADDSGVVIGVGVPELARAPSRTG